MGWRTYALARSEGLDIGPAIGELSVYPGGWFWRNIPLVWIRRCRATADCRIHPDARVCPPTDSSFGASTFC